MATNDELEKAKKLLKDQVIEVGFLDNAFKTLSASITSAIDSAIDDMQGLDDITKKVAKSYQQDITASIKKSTKGLEDQIALTQKINAGKNVGAEIEAKLSTNSARRLVTQGKINLLEGISEKEKKKLLGTSEDVFRAEEKALKILKAENEERQKSKSFFQIAKENAGSILDKIDKSGTASKVLSGGISSVLTPMRLLELAAVGVFDALVSIDKLNGELAKGLNISYSEASALSTELSEAANKSGSLSITTQGLGEALMAANGELGIFNTTIDDNLILFQKLHKTAGLTYEELSGIKSITEATGGDLNKNTQEIMAQAILTSQKFGVALNEKEVLKDISKVSAATTLSLGKNPGQIAAAVSATKALGMEMSKVEGIADSLLNFESSIEKELQAELLTGKNLNLEKARQLALNNDIAGVAEEIAKQAGSAAEFGEMNRIQQEALAGAVGMTREELAKSLFTQEQIGNLTGDEYEIRKKQIEELEGKGLSQKQIAAELGKQSIDDLKHQNSVQENLNKSVNKMKEAFIGIAAPLMQLITPIIDLLIPALSSIPFILAPVFDTFRGIAGILTGSSESLSNMEKIMGGIGVAALVYLGITKSIAAFEFIIATRKANQLLMDEAMLYLEASKKVGIFSTIGALTLQLGIQLGLLSASLATNAAVTFGVGVAIAVAAAAAGYAAITAMTGDDVMSPGENTSGYGKRTLMGPEGAIALNNKDTVIAGTDLFPKENESINPNSEVSKPQQTIVQQPTVIQQDNSKMEKLLERALNRPNPVIEMSGDRLGTAVGKYAYSIQ